MTDMMNLPVESVNPPEVIQTKKGRPRIYTAAERVERLRHYIKNDYYPKHKEEYRERSRQYYQRNKARLNSKKKQQVTA